MPPSAVERVVAALCTVAGIAFFAVGLAFVARPDEVLAGLERVGTHLGAFAPLPRHGTGFWVCLTGAYMAVVTVLAALVAWRPRAFALLLLPLAVGKATSSLTTLALYRTDRPAFAYLANFLTDGAIALLALASLGALLVDGFAAGRDPLAGLGDPWQDGATRARGRELLAAFLPTGPVPAGTTLETFLGFLDGLHPMGRRLFAWVVDLFWYAPPVLGFGLGSMASLDPAARHAYVASWLQSSWPTRRWLAANLRFLLFTVHYGQEAAARPLGYRGVEPLGPVPA